MYRTFAIVVFTFLGGADKGSDKYTPREAKKFTVRVGSAFRDKGGATFDVSRVFVHPGLFKSFFFNYLMMSTIST